MQLKWLILPQLDSKATLRSPDPKYAGTVQLVSTVFTPTQKDSTLSLIELRLQRRRSVRDGWKNTTANTQAVPFVKDILQLASLGVIAMYVITNTKLPLVREKIDLLSHLLPFELKSDDGLVRSNESARNPGRMQPLDQSEQPVQCKQDHTCIRRTGCVIV